MAGGMEHLTFNNPQAHSTPMQSQHFVQGDMLPNQYNGFTGQKNTMHPQNGSYVPQENAYANGNGTYIPEGSAYVPQENAYANGSSAHIPKESAYVPQQSANAPQQYPQYVDEIVEQQQQPVSMYSPGEVSAAKKKLYGKPERRVRIFSS